MARAFRIVAMVWLGLLALLALTVAATFAPLGAARLPLSLLIAGGKAALVVWVYMHLREERGIVRVIALAALLWLALLLLLSAADFLTRSWFGAA